MFPCNPGSCLRVAVAIIVTCVPVYQAVAAEAGRVVVSPMATLGKLAVALIIVLLVFWLFAKLMRHLQGYQAGAHHGLSIVSALSVGQRERVVVVQVGDQQIVLGVTSSQINQLHVMDRPLTQTPTGVQQNDFKKKLSAALKREVSSA